MISSHPKALEKGSRIALIATARWVEESLVIEAEAKIRDEGFEPMRGKNLMKRHGQFAGTDVERAADLQAALNDPQIRAIFIMRGGYGTHRILAPLDLKNLQHNPKWIVGFSDVTALHGLLQNHGIPSLHAAMPSTYSGSTQEALHTLFIALKGAFPNWSIATDSRSIQGQAEGRLVGGNLSVLSSILGTDCFPVQEGDILVLEDIDEMIYHVDRMMLQFDRAGILQKLNGLILGGFSEMRDNTKAFGFSNDNPYGMTAEEIILSYAKPLGIPVMVGAPVGHIADNRAMILGAHAVLTVNRDTSALSYI